MEMCGGKLNHIHLERETHIQVHLENILNSPSTLKVCLCSSNRLIVKTIKNNMFKKIKRQVQ